MAPVSNYDTTGIETHAISSFTLTNGDTLPITISYHRFNPSSPRTVLIPTCFGGRINTTLSFTTGALASYHVVVVAMLGNGESSSASNLPDDAPFPTHALDYRDQIKAQHQLLTEHLGVAQLEAVVGFSMGGQQAYYWAAMHPEMVRRAVVICSSARTSGHNYAFLEGPRAALFNSMDYTEGTRRAKGAEGAQRGVKAFGRAYLAWLYSQAWFRAGKWKGVSGKASIAEFAESVGNGLFEGWVADDLLALSGMWQRGDIGVLDGKGDYQETLRRIEADVLLMPGRTDQYFPPEDSEEEMKFLKKGKLEVIESIWGHAAGGGANASDVEFMDAKIAEFLA